MYLSKRAQDRDRTIISSRQYRTIKSELSWLNIALGQEKVSELSTERMQAYLEAPRQHPRQRSTPTETPSLKTWNNRRGLLGTFFAFCLGRDFIAENPILSIPQHRIKRRRATAQTLSAEKAGDLMTFLEAYDGLPSRRALSQRQPGFLVPFFALALFAGIRPDWKDGEISKVRPVNIDLANAVIRIEPEAAKTNEKRQIKIQPNLKHWLKKYPIPEDGAVPSSNPDRILRDIRQRFDLSHDVLRHTYCSMTVGAFRSVGDAALQAGNSEAIIRQNYLDLKTEAEADAFWRIMPEGMGLPEEMEKREGRYFVA